MKNTKNNIDRLINKVINETMSEKAENLVKNINELGGMEDSHPRFGKVNLMTMTDDEIKALLNQKIDNDDDFEENIDDLEDLSYEEDEEETNEGFDSEKVYINRRGKDYSPREFKRIPKNVDLMGDLPFDSMHMRDYQKRRPFDDFDDEFDSDDDGSELVFEMENGVCEQCGAKGSIMEGECNECGYRNEGIYDEEDINDENEFDYVETDEEIETTSTVSNQEKLEDYCNEESQLFDEQRCRYNRKALGMSEIKEKLYGRQRNIDKNKNGKIDAEDFKLLRKNKKKGGETDEQWQALAADMAVAAAPAVATWALDKAFGESNESNKKEPMKSAAKDAKKKTKGSVKLTENEIIDLIEKLVKEEKSNLRKGTKHKGTTTYEKAHRGSGKENSDYIKSVTKKMKDYLKDGSKGEYSMEPKIFPKGNGELAKMSKKAYVPSDAIQDYTDNLTAAGLENITYDEINPNEDWVNDLMVGSSKTGNNPEWANSVDTGVNKKRRKVQKDNLLGQIKKKAYNKAPQPIISDKTGNDEGSKLLTKLESVEPKQTEKLNEEFDRMKQLLSYNRKTQ
jgi:hypothetical protein